MDQKNTILAIALSALVLIVWQYFFGLPQMQKQQEHNRQQQQQAQPSPNGQTASRPAGAPAVPGQPAGPSAVPATREALIAAGPRVQIDTPRVKGSIALKGGRLDDLSLATYHETVEPNSPPIVLLAPSGSPHPFYAEFG